MSRRLVNVTCADLVFEVCGDCKVIAVSLGMRARYTKYSCFLCKWDGSTGDTHCSTKHWPHRQSLTPGMKTVIHKPLIKPSKDLTPPLHINLLAPELFF